MTHTEPADLTADAAAAGREVLFRDDFSGAALDLGKWQPNWLGATDSTVTPPVNGQEASCYDPACVTVEGGHLVLAAIAKAQVDSHGTRHAYSSGIVTSRHDFTFTPPARLEARLLLPGSNGLIDNWPSLWADGTGQWPQTGENDIVEGLRGHPAYHFHYLDEHGVQQGPGGGGALKPRPHAPDGTIGWHHFAADWYPDHIDYAYDGEHVGTIDQGVTEDPMYVILQLALSASISPPIRVPSRLLVDWVQVVRLHA